MVIKLHVGATREDLEKAVQKLTEGKVRPSLKKYYGSLQRGIDGLQFQKSIRRED